MPTVEQKIITVSNNDTALNASLTAEAPDGWLAQSLTISGSDVIILYTRTIAPVA